MSSLWQLYSVAAEYQLVLNDMLEHDFPEDAIENTISTYSSDVRKMAVSVAATCKNLEAEVKAISEALKEMEARKDSLEKKHDKLRSGLLKVLEKCEIKKITDSPYFTISLRKCAPSVSIIDEKMIPKNFIKIKTEEKIKKTDIANALKSGASVPGAILITDKNSLIIA